MAKVIPGAQRGRPGRYILDYTDAAGVRRWKTFKTRGEAMDALARVIPESRQHTKPLVDPRITVSAYSELWLSNIAATVRPRSLDSYESALRVHILPALGSLKIRNLTRARIRNLLISKLKDGLVRSSVVAGVAQEQRGPMAKPTVHFILATIRSMLNAAIDDQIILANPADRLGRALKLVLPREARAEEVKALDREQTAAFIAATSTAPTAYERRFAPLFLCLVRAGLRLGEGLGLQWDDLDLTGRKILVRRSISKGHLGVPKAGHGRTVDMSQELAGVLRRLKVDRAAETLKKGWREVPAWVFATINGHPLDASRVRKIMLRALERAGLPLHFSPHALRHTFASQLLAQGESPQYVQQQLGHATLALTTDLYGKHLPKLPLRGGVDALDGEQGVAKAVIRSSSSPQVAIEKESVRENPRRRDWPVPRACG